MNTPSPPEKAERADEDGAYLPVRASSRTRAARVGLNTPHAQSRAVDEVRQATWRSLAGRKQVKFQRTRFLWLQNPKTLHPEERACLSALLRLNVLIVKAYLLKEDVRIFRDNHSTAWAAGHLRRWLWRASHDLGLHREYPPLLCEATTALRLLGEQPTFSMPTGARATVVEPTPTKAFCMTL